MEKRIKRLTITGDFLVQFLQGDGTRSVRFDGMPADAKIVCVSNDSLRGRAEDVVLFIESEAFDPVTEGNEYPTFTIRCTATGFTEILTPMANWLRDGMATQEDIDEMRRDSFARARMPGQRDDADEPAIVGEG